MSFPVGISPEVKANTFPSKLPQNIPSNNPYIKEVEAHIVGGVIAAIMLIAGIILLRGYNQGSDNYNVGLGFTIISSIGLAYFSVTGCIHAIFLAIERGYFCAERASLRNRNG